MEYEVRPEENVSVAVVEAVGEHENRRPLSLPPLADVIDPDALDRLFASTTDGVDRRPGMVSFQYSHSHVVIDPDESITVANPPRTDVQAPQ